MKKNNLKKLSLRKNIVAQLGKPQMDSAMGGSDVEPTFYCTTQCTGQYSKLCNTGDVKCVTENIYVNPHLVRQTGHPCMTGQVICSN